MKYTILLLLFSCALWGQGKDTLRGRAKVILIDSIYNIVPFTFDIYKPHAYYLVLIEGKFNNSNKKERQIVRNMSKFNLVEGKHYKITAEKFEPSCKVFNSRFLMEKDSSIYSLIEVR